MLLPDELAISEANLTDGLADLLDASRNISPSEDTEGLYFRISYNYRLLGLCALLKDANRDAFQESLYKSARARLYFLRRINNGGTKANAQTTCVSKNFPFFDSLAISRLDVAKELALHSRSTYMEGFEYEEDFLYQHILHRYVVGDEPAILKSLLGRFSALDDNETGKVSVCEAMLSGDADLFDAAIGRRIDARDEKYRKLRERRSLHPDLLRMESYIFVEGMGLVQLADHAGIAVQKDYKYIPGFARVPRHSFPEDDSWRTAPILP